MPSASAARQLADFIRKFDAPTAKLIRQCRTEMRRLLPSTIELVYDNYNFFVIGYASSERASDCVVSLAAAANGLVLSLYHGASLADPDKLLLGSGKQNRFIRIPRSDMLRSPKVVALVGAAVTQARTPLAPKGIGYTVIKSISPNQRPRRKTPLAQNRKKAKRLQPEKL
jgi:hypothetical protein